MQRWSILYATTLREHVLAGALVRDICLSECPLLATDILASASLGHRMVSVFSSYHGAEGTPYDGVAQAYGVERLENTPVRVSSERPGVILPPLGVERAA